MILVFGSINLDLVTRVAAIPRPGETVLSPGYETLFGGKGANQAVAAARASRPGCVSLVARIGDDGFGRAARNNLMRNGVDVAGVGTGAEPTGCAFITVDQHGENAITVASGANAMLDRSAVPPSMITADTVLVLQMEVPFEEALAVARQVRDVGGTVIWNFAPVPARFSRQDLADMLVATDFLVVNEHEAMAAAAILDVQDTTFLEAARRLAGAGALTCVVTAGADGAYVTEAEGACTQFPATPIMPLDTTGAGDTFVGVLASGIDEGRAWPDTMSIACRGASIACLSPGAQTGMPYRKDLWDGA